MKKIRLAEALSREIEERDMTVSKLAKECKIPISVLHGWINGTSPSAKNIHHLYSLCQYLDLSLDQLLFGVRTSMKDRSIIFQSIFMDGENQYKLTVEKISKEQK